MSRDLDLHTLFGPLLHFLENREGFFRIHGLKGSSPAYLLSRILGRTRGPWVILTADEEKADRFRQELLFFLDPDQEVDVYPGWEVKPFERISPQVDAVGQRWKVRSRLLSDPGRLIVVAPLRAVLQRVPPRAIHAEQSLSLSPDLEFGREELIRRLQGMGYFRSSLVTEVGEFAVRGYLVDLFPPSTPAPVRIEFSGDTVDSVRLFDPESQRSSEALEEARVLPVKEVLLFPERFEEAARKLSARIAGEPPSKKDPAHQPLERMQQGIPFPGLEFYLPDFYPSLETFFDFLPPRATLFLEAQAELEEELGHFWEEAGEAWQNAFSRDELWPSPGELFLKTEEFQEWSRFYPRVSFPTLEVGEEGDRLRLETDSNERLRSELLSSKSEDGILRLLAQRIRSGRDKGMATILACFSLRSAQRLAEMLEKHDLAVQILEKPFSAWTPEDSQNWDVTLLLGNLPRGFVFPRAGLALITESELFGEKRLRKRPAVSVKDHALAAFSDLQVDDFVVHTEHGIGVYRGLWKLKLGNEEHDFLLLEYQDGDKLYLPVYRLNLLQKYVGGGDGGPRLDKLGGTSWENAKRKVKKSLRELAEELIQLYATRSVVKGHAFSTPDQFLKEFEASFEYEETPDQMQAIEDVQ